MSQLGKITVAFLSESLIFTIIETLKNANLHLQLNLYLLELFLYKLYYNMLILLVSIINKRVKL